MLSFNVATRHFSVVDTQPDPACEFPTNHVLSSSVAEFVERVQTNESIVK